MRKAVLTVTAIVAVCLAQSAGAATLYSLTEGNPDISSYAGPYGSVEVNLTDPTHATITFTAASGYLFGAQGLGGVNVNASSFTLSGLSASTMSDGGAANEDGFGLFNQTIDNFDGYTHALSTFSFTLTDTAGTWANSDSVLAPNAGGSHVAAHIFVIGTDGALATGYAADGSQVPDGGSTMALLGLAMVGFGSVRRFFRG